MSLALECGDRAVKALGGEILHFFFNDTATTEIYTLSLHDALPICESAALEKKASRGRKAHRHHAPQPFADRKSTRLNSSHLAISYAGFCLKRKSTDLSARLVGAATARARPQCPLDCLP